MVIAPTRFQKGTRRDVAGDNRRDPPIEAACREPGAILASPHVSDLVRAFIANHAEGSVVVCGPQRVRTVLGSAGVPGLLPLVLQKCALATLSCEKEGAPLFGLAAFFALPESSTTSVSSLPALDALDGCSRKEAWEHCAVETFADVHKVYGVIVRLLVGGAAVRGEAGGCDDDSRKRYDRCIGRLPLVFRIVLLTEAGAQAGAYGFTQPVVIGRSLLFVDSPPAHSGGPLSSAYRGTVARLRIGTCCVLYAAPGERPESTTLIRSSLGPLNLLLDTDLDPHDEHSLPQIACTLTSMDDEAHRACVELSQIVAVMERCRGAGAAAQEYGSGSVGVPPSEVATVWHAPFSLREVTLAEARRQLPLSRHRLERLNTLLSAVGHQPVTVPSGAVLRGETLDAARTSTRSVSLFHSLSTLAWQRQWQTQELLERFGSSDERHAIQVARHKAEALEASLIHARQVADAAITKERGTEESFSAELLLCERKLEDFHASEAVEASKVKHQSGLREVERRACLEQERERMHFENLVAALQDSLRGAQHEEAHFQEAAARAEAWSRSLSEELKAAHAAQQSTHRQPTGRWRGGDDDRVRELEAERQRLMRELGCSRMDLEVARNDHGQLRTLLERETASRLAAELRAGTLEEELTHMRALMKKTGASIGFAQRATPRSRASSGESTRGRDDESDERGAQNLSPRRQPSAVTHRVSGYASPRVGPGMRPPSAQPPIRNVHPGVRVARVNVAASPTASASRRHSSPAPAVPTFGARTDDFVATGNVNSGLASGSSPRASSVGARPSDGKAQNGRWPSTQQPSELVEQNSAKLTRGTTSALNAFGDSLDKSKSDGCEHTTAFHPSPLVGRAHATLMSGAANALLARASSEEGSTSNVRVASVSPTPSPLAGRAPAKLMSGAANALLARARGPSCERAASDG